MQLDINYEDGFCCPKCGNQPQAVVMDATMQPTFQKITRFMGVGSQSVQVERRKWKISGASVLLKGGV